MIDSNASTETRRQAESQRERLKICPVCGQIFDEFQAEQTTHHDTQPHEPLL
jgi:hypothetical protein